ncbi:MAG: tRNA epoxyqueuosine(34) reductase QueG [Bacteroidota bacterium]|nr:tRNA epoxyqueuosine(34) reductase QueG [Bacteroidota bacterium]
MIDLKGEIREKALELGFTSCGFAHADKFEEMGKFFKDWISEGFNGEMEYLERNVEKRINPALLVENAQTVISLLTNYYPAERQKGKEVPLISIYTYGEDYHVVIKRRLFLLLDYIKKLDNGINGRVFVDSAPVLEKAWAARCGLGWIGKNNILINEEVGSFHFISEIIIDYELESDSPAPNLCGECRKCIDACPTKALIAPHKLDARKCISYLTIEQRKNVPDNYKELIARNIYGCDICQDACPWNKFAKPHNDKELMPHEELLGMTKEEWENMDEERFKKILGNTAAGKRGRLWNRKTEISDMNI